MASSSIIKLLPISRYRTRMFARLKEDTGVSAVEFALILPVLVIILFGIIEFGILLYDKAVITNASREGARAGTVHVAEFMGIDDETLKANVKTMVENLLTTSLINLGAPDTTANVLVDLSSPDPDVDRDLTVTVNYSYDFLVLPNFSGLTGQVNLVGETVMRME